MSAPVCRLCGAPLLHSFVDLGRTPLANAFVTPEQAERGEDQAYELHARVCDSCLLVQVNTTVSPQAIFSEYAYFSSVSPSWVAHAGRYAAAMIQRFGMGRQSLVIEVASNDGYLLQHFKAAGIPVLGIEPAANIAAVARQAGIPTETTFFSPSSAATISQRHGRADLMVANNVLAHVPDIIAFVASFSEVLRPEGVVTFEFPHLLNMIAEVQFDTIYHEHFSYLSLLVVERVLQACGMRAFDVAQLSTHGGSLRVFACRTGAQHAPQADLDVVRSLEAQAGLDRPKTYDQFAPRVAAVRQGFRDFMLATQRSGRRLAAYGAAAKGNTLLNCCGIGREDVICVGDRSRVKQGKLLPGSHIPVVTPEALRAARPDDVLLLPWNLAEEIGGELQPLREDGARLWVAIPRMREI